MSTPVFAAVLLAALLHALWNALVKNGADKHLAMTAVVLGHLPVAAISLLFVPSPAPESWPLLVSSVTLHTGYQLFLTWSYRIGDLTQVYPIARGSAPLIVAGVSLAFLGVVLQPLELVAIFIIAAGIMSIGLVRQADGLRNARAAGLALATGCFIAAYSLVDGTGARMAGTSLGYFSWLAIINAGVYSIFIAISRRSIFNSLATEGRTAFLVGGSASFCSYALVTWAFTQAPIALVTALRETSIVFALLIGVFFLKERLDLAKVTATLATILGAALLRLSRL